MVRLLHNTKNIGVHQRASAVDKDLLLICGNVRTSGCPVKHITAGHRIKPNVDVSPPTDAFDRDAGGNSAHDAPLVLVIGAASWRASKCQPGLTGATPRAGHPTSTNNTPPAVRTR